MKNRALRFQLMTARCSAECANWRSERSSPRHPLRITHSGFPPRKRPGAAIPLVFPGESHFRDAYRRTPTLRFSPIERIRSAATALREDGTHPMALRI